MRLPPFRAAPMACALFLALAACDTAEERAEGHFESALDLIEAGDVARAKVELRTVFSLVPDHKAARETFAKLLYDEGDFAAAFGQYNRLVEEDPDALLARYVVAELLVLDNEFDAAQEHLDAVQRLAPSEARAQILANVTAYRDAVLGEDIEARRAAGARALELAENLPESRVNNTVIADALILDERYDQLYDQLDRIIALYPEERRFHVFRLTAYGRQEDNAGIERTMRDMIEAFPDDETLPQSMMRFYSSQGDLDGAEEFLRSRIVPGQADDGARLSLARFLGVARGPEAAIDEVRGFISEGTNDLLFAATEASLLYDTGERDQALDLFAGLVARAEASEQTNNIKSAYAELLRRDGNEVGARALVEEVLEADPSHVASLLMRADWFVADDRAEEAVLALRVAQDQEPENPEIFTRLAEAYLRNGERTLAGEMLSLAASTSNRAPEPSIRYARFLRADERLTAAEAVLIDALRLAPGDRDILVELGTLYVAMQDWRRAEDVERALREPGLAELDAQADRLRLLSLRAQGRSEEAVTFLETFTEDAAPNLRAEIAIAETLLDDGRAEEARDHIATLVEENPDVPGLVYVLARAHMGAGDLDAAEPVLRSLVEAGTTFDQIWEDYIRVLSQNGKRAEAEAVLQKALVVVPDSADLKWFQASILERNRDFEGAIVVYEELYALNDGSPIIANNLASLLSTVREDPDSLDRADRIARRLRGTDVPAFQDTYGWIRYLQGDYQEALEYLRPAADGLSTDPMVQLHLGLTYDALERTEDAIAQIARAVEMAGDDPRPAFARARDRLTELQNSDTGAGSESGGGGTLPSNSDTGVRE